MLHTNWTEYIRFFTGLVAIVNPIGAIPLFISLTPDESPRQHRTTSMVAALTMGSVLAISLIVGEPMLRFFGISIASFRVGGGILVLLIAISMLHARVSQAKHTPEEAEDAAAKESVAAVPLGMPLLAGPGAISTVIVFAHESHGVAHYLLGGLVIGLLTALVWLAFLMGPAISRLLGTTGINIITRIMGLIIAAVGIEFIAEGLRQLLPGLA